MVAVEPAPEQTTETTESLKSENLDTAVETPEKLPPLKPLDFDPQELVITLLPKVVP